jgi:hypothetical protein
VSGNRPEGEGTPGALLGFRLLRLFVRRVQFEAPQLVADAPQIPDLDLIRVRRGGKQLTIRAEAQSRDRLRLVGLVRSHNVAGTDLEKPN